MSAERDFVCAARPSSSTRSPRFKSPSSMRARPTSGAAQHLLRNPVRLAHDRELVVVRWTSRGVRRARCTKISNSSAKANGCG